MPELYKVLKRLGFERRESVREHEEGFVFLNPRAKVGRFCYDPAAFPELPVAIVRKRKRRGTRAILVVTKAATWFREGGMVEDDRQLLRNAGCTFIDHLALEDPLETAA